MDAEVQPEELADNLHQKAILILDAIAEHDGEADTSQITDYTDMPNNTAHYWFKKLMASDVIEQNGEAEAERGIPPKIYALTERGEEVRKELTGVSRGKGTTLADLQREMNAVAHTLGETRKDVRGLDADVDGLQQSVGANQESGLLRLIADVEHRQRKVVNKQLEVIKLLLDEHPDVRKKVTEGIL